MNRYSDNIPYNERKFWYFTTHGLGPGTIPKDLKLLQVIEAINGDYICLDGVLNTSELQKYDIIEKAPREFELVEQYLKYSGVLDMMPVDISVDKGEITLTIHEESEENHKFCQDTMKKHGYELKSEIPIEKSDYYNTYTLTYVYMREDGTILPEFMPI